MIFINYYLLNCLVKLFATFYYQWLILSYESWDRILKQELTGSTSRQAESPEKDQLCVKTISIYNYSQLQHLKETISGKESIILIVRIAPILSKDPGAGTKLVDSLYSTHAIKNNYSVFRLGEERIMVIPNVVQTESFKL
jgi:SepF-like predicted cell division protein (DUF552 family)